MIIRRDEVSWSVPSEGPSASLRLFELGGITQFGAYVDRLEPGARASDRHWHEAEDEFLYMLTGEATIVDEDGEQVIVPGDAVCWPAGIDKAHTVFNHTNAVCTYLICGTRVDRDIVHYPDIGQTLHVEGSRWRIVGDDGTVLKEGVE